jgi:hypothetical protein
VRARAARARARAPRCRPPLARFHAQLRRHWQGVPHPTLALGSAGKGARALHTAPTAGPAPPIANPLHGASPTTHFQQPIPHDPSPTTHPPRPIPRSFQAGDLVRVLRENAPLRWRRPHLRTPGYIFGLVGRVERECVGTFKVCRAVGEGAGEGGTGVSATGSRRRAARRPPRGAALAARREGGGGSCSGSGGLLPARDRVPRARPSRNCPSRTRAREHAPPQDPERGAFREAGPRVPLYRWARPALTLRLGRCLRGPPSGKAAASAPRARRRAAPSKAARSPGPWQGGVPGLPHRMTKTPNARTSRVRFAQSHIWEGYAGGASDTVDMEVYQVSRAACPSRAVRLVGCLLCQVDGPLASGQELQLPRVYLCYLGTVYCSACRNIGWADWFLCACTRRPIPADVGAPHKSLPASRRGTHPRAHSAMRGRAGPGPCVCPRGRARRRGTHPVLSCVPTAQPWLEPATEEDLARQARASAAARGVLRGGPGSDCTVAGGSGGAAAGRGHAPHSHGHEHDHSHGHGHGHKHGHSHDHSHAPHSHGHGHGAAPHSHDGGEPHVHEAREQVGAPPCGHPD